MGPLPLLALLALTTSAERLTLDRALALAAKRNADVALANLDRDAAAVEVRGSYEGVLPRLDLTASVGHQYQGAQEQAAVVQNPAPPPPFIREVTTYGENDFGQYQFALNFNWTFFDGLATWNLIDASKRRAEAAHKQFDETSLRIAFLVTQRFYELVRQERGLDVRKEAADLSAELVKRADALFAAGRGTRADTFSARVNLGNDQLAVQTQLAAVVRARTDLAVVLGLSSDAGLEVEIPDTVTGAHPLSVEEPPPLPNLLSQARTARPALSALKLSIDAADSDIARARAAYWPTLSLQASYQKATPDFSGSFGVFGDPTNQATAVAQITLAYNIFAGGDTKTGVERAEVQARRAQTQLEQAEETVAQEVTNARSQVETLASSLALQQTVLDNSSKDLGFARERLEAGVGSQLEVRDAALKLSQAKLAWVSNIIDLVVARADLNRAVGGTL